MIRSASCVPLAMFVLILSGCAASSPTVPDAASTEESTPASDSSRVEEAGDAAPSRAKRAEALISSLREAYVDGAYEEVVRRARTQRPDSLRSSAAHQVYTLLGRAEQARGRDRAALEALRSARVAAIEEEESVVHIDRALGESYVALYQWPQAASAFKRVLDAKPDDRAVRQALAEVYRRARDWEQARTQYRRLVRADSSNGQWWARLAQCDLELNRQDEALRHFSKAHQVLPQSADVALSLSRLYRSAKQPDRARRVVDTTLAYQPGDTRLWRRKADLAFEHDDLETAQRAYRRTAALGDSTATVYRRLGLIHVKRQEFADALPPLRKSFRENSRHQRTNLYLGISYLKVDSLEQASRYLENTIDRAVEGPITRAYSNLGATKNRQGEVAAAVRAYRTVLQLQPDRTEALFRLATVYDEHYETKTTAARHYRRYLTVSDSSQTQLRSYAENRLEALQAVLHMEEGRSDSTE